MSFSTGILNNGELLEYVRSVCSDKKAADLLKYRWESFWENDYKTLARQRFDIDRLIDEKNLERSKHAGRLKELAELQGKLEQYESGKKIRGLRATVQRLEKEIRKLRIEADRIKKPRKVAVEAAAEEHALSSEIKELKAKVQRMAWTITELRRVKSIGSFMITPPFEIFDHPKAHPSSTEVARMARIIHDRG